MSIVAKKGVLASFWKARMHVTSEFKHPITNSNMGKPSAMLQDSLLQIFEPKMVCIVLFFRSIEYTFIETITKLIPVVLGTKPTQKIDTHEVLILVSKY
jgi:hypothetical protein